MKTPGRFYFRNDVLQQSTSLELLDFDNVDSVYEVIRIIDGISLFVEKHMERFKKSAELAKLSFSLNLDEITANIAKLAKENQLPTGNVKLIYTFNSRTPDISSGELFIYFIPHNYPENIEYQTGVRLILLSAERPNPNAKIHNGVLRNQANELIDQKNVFEVLLTNHVGFVTEGSRSNVFFISKSKVVTPPLDMVLPGITRDVVINIIKDQHIDFEEKMIHLSQLDKFDAAFITGTSPKVLPIAAIDHNCFDPQQIFLRQIIKLYDQMILDYLNKKMK